MRRSAAPSQLLHKRTLFTPPFAKRRCPDTHTDDVPKASALPQTVENNVKVRDGPVRSSSDILSLIKKPSTITETSCVRQCSNGVPECDTGQENAPTDSVTVLSPLRETHSNTLRSTGDANKRFPAQQLGTASRMLGGYARVGKGPQGIPGHRRSVVPAQEENQEAQAVKYYSVVWCKFSRKKHKNWEGDAVLIVKSRSVILKDTEGKEIGRRTGYKLKDLSSLEEGSTLLVGGGKEVENIDEAQEKRSQPPKPKPFRLPTLGRPKDKNTNTAVGPLFDPTKPDALLRPHQQEGVIFLYECIMGYRHLDNYGAILADEMGLGKTLQCITLVWTLLKQGPYGGRSVVKKVLIVTPSSLTNNWSKEFSKWLGRERVNVYIVDQNNKVEQFEKQKHSEIMIISYEMFVRSSKIIEALNFDLVLCDEGHRLKNTNIKTAHLLGGLRCRRRELFALVEFVNPGVLGSSLSFRHIYEDPIIASQQPNASQTEKELGASRATQLNKITSLFILRRTQDIINRYLPPKVEFVVFCQPSETQVSVYMDLVGCRSLKKCFSNVEPGDNLSAILALRKLCNHPALLAADKDQENKSDVVQEAANLLPPHIQPGVYDEGDSGKLAVVSCILWALREPGTEKIVLVSNYTTTLDMLAALCTRYNYPYLRLDGSTPTNKRQQLVDRFNSKYSKDFVFLLSSKAGGVGLNLIGASRILLYDIDWNPATDLQAMARKMYQRQVKKQGLSGAVVDARDTDRVHFSTEELKIKLYGGECPGGSLSTTSTSTMDQLHNWCHLAPPFSSAVVKDPCLEAASDFISFLFCNESNTEIMKMPSAP
ncbi:DNA repair and recombination protein RAD54-like 1 [Homarus americanus]|uniref:DNA repair and recombination protein RAD54-like n=1 Tax=Homarus americanus TaxID=6706 RepID=A0A8J5NCD3_HOMAM|nr:DNA repair and recombination protein RAD54-like 1 [Homarus americanus]